MRGSGMTYFCGWKLKILLFSDSSSSSTMDLGGKSRRLSYILFSHVQCCLVYLPDEITINDYAMPYGTGNISYSFLLTSPISHRLLFGWGLATAYVGMGSNRVIRGFGMTVKERCCVGRKKVKCLLLLLPSSLAFFISIIVGFNMRGDCDGVCRVLVDGYRS